MRRTLGILLALALLGAGCVKSATTLTHALTLKDNGSSIQVRFGERIQITLAPESGIAWDVYDYPRNALTLDSRDLKAGSFVFTVKGAGGGRIVAYFGPACGPGVVGATPGPSCEQGGEPVDPIGGSFPGPRVFTVSVTVALES